VTDRDEARDLVQDVWVAATERAPARIDRPRAWLAEVLRNALRARRRSAGPRAARERARARDAAVAGTGDVVERAEAQRLLVEHVLALDEPWRSTVLLRFFDGLSSEEIARRTGAPPSTIRNRLAHALGLLRARLERSRSNWMAGIAPLAFGGRRIGIGFGWSSGGTAMAGMLKVGGGLAAALAEAASRARDEHGARFRSVACSDGAARARRRARAAREQRAAAGGAEQPSGARERRDSPAERSPGGRPARRRGTVPARRPRRARSRVAALDVERRRGTAGDGRRASARRWTSAL
jgi:RNA polymerase sigma-70 factor (ECF subfamily)